MKQSAPDAAKSIQEAAQKMEQAQKNLQDQKPKDGSAKVTYRVRLRF